MSKYQIKLVYYGRADMITEYNINEKKFDRADIKVNSSNVRLVAFPSAGLEGHDQLGIYEVIKVEE